MQTIITGVSVLLTNYTTLFARFHHILKASQEADTLRMFATYLQMNFAGDIMNFMPILQIKDACDLMGCRTDQQPPQYNFSGKM